MLQFLAAALGAASAAAADWLYQQARIGRRCHSCWVSMSISVICLPVFVWISNIFFGSGLFAEMVAGTLVVAIFIWVYRNLPRASSVQGLGPPPRRPPSAAVPPVSGLNG